MTAIRYRICRNFRMTLFTKISKIESIFREYKFVIGTQYVALPPIFKNIFVILANDLFRKFSHLKITTCTVHHVLFYLLIGRN